MLKLGELTHRYPGTGWSGALLALARRDPGPCSRPMPPDPDPPNDPGPDPYPTPEPADEPPPGHLALTRRELYEKVWSAPMIRFARAFRCSSTWFAQICADAGVPVPGRGYWAKKRAGKRATRRGLRKGLDPEVVLHYVPVPWMGRPGAGPTATRGTATVPTLDEDLYQGPRRN